MARRGISSTITDLKRGVAANPQSRALNPHLFEADAACGSPANTPPGSKAPIGAKPKGKGKKRGEMNRTEEEFSRMLEHRMMLEEFDSWAYEAITLRWGKMAYTPDFMVADALPKRQDKPDRGPFLEITFIEVKGGFIRPKDMIKFKTMKEAFKDEFRFELWQKKDRQWKQLI